MYVNRQSVACVALVVACALVAAGCGGSDSSSGSTSTKSASGATGASDTNSDAKQSQKLTLGVTEGAFKFDKSTLTAAAGKVTLELTNSESIQHNVAIKDADGKELAAGEIVGDKGVSTITVDLKPGTYEYYCTPHEALGMKGTLTVT